VPLGEGVAEDVNTEIKLVNLCCGDHEFFGEKLGVSFTAGARGRLSPSFFVIKCKNIS
jgi:hypothetical protein